ncbi:hypothetical protein [Nonomuraea recticatena]
MFGYGMDGRALATVRDRDAETIRTVLRKAGLREFSDRHGGFLVEGGYDDAPFLIRCVDWPEDAEQQLAHYEAALLKAGYRIKCGHGDGQALQAWP